MHLARTVPSFLLLGAVAIAGTLIETRTSAQVPPPVLSFTIGSTTYTSRFVLSYSFPDPYDVSVLKEIDPTTGVIKAAVAAGTAMSTLSLCWPAGCYVFHDATFSSRTNSGLDQHGQYTETVLINYAWMNPTW